MQQKRFTVNSYMKNHISYIFIWIIITVALGFFAPLKAFNLQWIIDSKNINIALFYLFLGVIVILTSHVLEFWSRKTFTDIACQSIDFIRGKMMEKILQRSMENYYKQEDSSYISLLTTDMRTLYDDYFTAIFNIVFWAAILVCALGMYLYINTFLLIVIACVSIPPLILPKFLQARLKVVREGFSQEMAHYTQQIKELLGGFETIRTFGREVQYDRIHSTASLENAESEKKLQQNMNLSMVATSLLSNGTFIVVLFSGMLLVFSGKITMGYMVTASSLANFVISPCQIIAQNYARLKATKGIRFRIEEVMNLDVSEKKTVVMHMENINKISCKNVQFTYPESEKAVLKNLNLLINQNEKIAIVGRSGCGKSTLAKLLYQYYADYQGEIQINGNELKQIERNVLYEQIGYISQKTFLFNDTIRNNICLYQDFTDAQMGEAIRMAGLEEYISSLPNGLDTKINENGKNLSGGQMQRIGIARMAIRKYSVIIADEITANLDVKTSEEVMENLLSLDVMIIAITHDTQSDFMGKFDAIYRMEDGKVVLQM